MFPQTTLSRRGFTLIELLTVIAIIGILAAILIPTVGKVRQSARKAQCVSNLRQIGIGIQGFAADNKGLLPPSTCTNPARDPAKTGMTGEIRWYRYINPYLNSRLYGMSADRKLIPHCPSYESPVPSTDGYWHHYTGYGYNNTIGDVFSNSSKTTYLHEIPSLSRFAIVFDVEQPQGKFVNFSASQLSFRHGEIGNLLLLDGHVVPLRKSANTGTTFAALYPDYQWVAP